MCGSSYKNNHNPMKFIHLSDLHIGKSVKSTSLLDDQRHILQKILDIIRLHTPDGILIAGDIYDHPNPSGEAMSLFDDFLYELSCLEPHVEVFIISGNHDSAERIAYGSRIMNRSGIHLSPIYNGDIHPILMHDSHGDLAVYMLPFVKPATVRHYFPDDEINTEDDAIRCCVEHFCDFDSSRRNICVAHQFITGASLSGVEEGNVGTLDAVGADVFEKFDYVALGHLHGPQDPVSNKVRYCGSPLKYSFSEIDHHKSVTLIDMAEKDNTQITLIPLDQPLHEWYDIQSTFDELSSQQYRDSHPQYVQAYLRVTLTDENFINGGFNALKAVYPNLLELHYDNQITRNANNDASLSDTARKNIEELFSELFKAQMGRPMDEHEVDFIHSLSDSLNDN